MDEGETLIEFRNVSLWYCITYAYGMKSYQVSGPDWLREGRYDIVARGPAGTVREQLPQMMQALLEERFKLRFRRQTKEIAGLALIVGKNGAKLTEAAAESGDGAGGAQIGISATPAGVFRMDVKGASMASLANNLTGMLGQPVFDRSGLTGRYDFVLEFSPSDTAGRGPGGGYNEPPPFPTLPGAEPGFSIFSSIQTLGLKLDPAKFPLETMAIERAERTPTEN